MRSGQVIQIDKGIEDGSSATFQEKNISQYLANKQIQMTYQNRLKPDQSSRVRHGNISQSIRWHSQSGAHSTLISHNRKGIAQSIKTKTYIITP